MVVDTMRWQDGILWLLDQTKLPRETVYIKCKEYETVAKAIQTLAVRGAPAIGVAAAYGLVLGAMAKKNLATEAFVKEVQQIAQELGQTRPTAVNLNWALQRMLKQLQISLPATPEDLCQILLSEAHSIYQEDCQGNQNMGIHALPFIPNQAKILTHCNAGALATASFGTALGIVRAAHQKGKNISVYACETRPLLQGARLTAWEMLQEQIPVTLITDNMAAYAMAKGLVDMVILGADRIAANGDTANKIGTYGLAVLAKKHGLPFYVAAPLSTIDLSLTSGNEIPIEERQEEEITHIAGIPIAPEGIQVWNPAFDITPADFITAIFTEVGVVQPPYDINLANIMQSS